MRQNYKIYVLSEKEWILCILQSIGITGIINFFCYRSWWAWGLGIPIGIWYVRWRKKELAERRRRILRNHFKEVLQGLQTAVRGRIFDGTGGDGMQERDGTAFWEWG